MQGQLEVSDYSQFAETTLEEHHRLSEARSRLRRLLEECISHPGGVKRRELGTGFQSFREMLLEHMLSEEKNGFMSPLVEAHPNLAPKIAELEREHDYIRRELDGILRNLEPAKEFTRPIMDIVIRLANLLDVIGDHERTENGLVLDSF